MKQRTVKHNIDGLAALLLFGIFAACVLCFCPGRALIAA